MALSVFSEGKKAGAERGRDMQFLCVRVASLVPRGGILEGLGMNGGDWAQNGPSL